MAGLPTELGQLYVSFDALKDNIEDWSSGKNSTLLWQQKTHLELYTNAWTIPMISDTERSIIASKSHAVSLNTTHAHARPLMTELYYLYLYRYVYYLHIPLIIIDILYVLWHTRDGARVLQTVNKLWYCKPLHPCRRGIENL